MTWEAAQQKFERLATPFTGTGLRGEVESIVRGLEHERVTTLTHALERVSLSRVT